MALRIGEPQIRKIARVEVPLAVFVQRGQDRRRRVPCRDPRLQHGTRANRAGQEMQERAVRPGTDDVEAQGLQPRRRALLEPSGDRLRLAPELRVDRGEHVCRHGARGAPLAPLPRTLSGAADARQDLVQNGAEAAALEDVPRDDEDRRPARTGYAARSPPTTLVSRVRETLFNSLSREEVGFSGFHRLGTLAVPVDRLLERRDHLVDERARACRPAST